MAQGRLRTFRGPIFLNQVEAGERHVEASPFRIFEQHEFRVAVTLVDFFEAPVLTNPVLDMYDIIPDLEIAKIGEKRRDLRFLALRARGDSIRFIEEVTRAEDGEMRVGKNDTVGHVRFCKRGRVDLSGEVDR